MIDTKNNPEIGSDEYTGGLYADAGEAYFDTMEEYLDACVSNESDPDGDLWTVETSLPSAPSAEELVGNVLEEEHYDEDFAEKIVRSARVKELQAYLDEWFRHESLRATFPTQTRVVLSAEHRALFERMKGEAS